ncbi:cysteine peptidase family C39 domain-containing protein [Halotia branconii]|uniref:Cysteine peptidase family C39 domain-containing protein n=1 Tax=Halotia branconii CENA392 TaxID=1539056 RepID=A0AAJ6NX83_9CYAN|nr:cysteine peptidase family C39 domain-containing protein [Halotia branconii]WGV28408.1 cysteine peptidase family C39 domain-containing protein [Halotia branconii CENA392]
MYPSSLLRVQRDLKKQTNNQKFLTPKAAIIRILQMFVGDTNLVSDFSQSWVVREFQLGDELTNYAVDNSSNLLYLVCQGRVRLLGFDTTVSREVSTQLLLAQQTFGADHLFCDQALPYRAIAAGESLVAQINITELQSWLQRLPHLESYLQQLAIERQTLLFFKSYTELRSLTSSTLRQLLPYLQPTKITAGSSLQEATSPTKGRFWLASGKVQTISAAAKPPHIGENWGYPHVKLPVGIAQTNLLVYRLAIEHWESVKEIAPQLFPDQDELVKEQQQPGTVSTDDRKPQILLPKLMDLPSRSSQLETPVSISTILEIPEIDFLTVENQRQSIFRFWRSYPFIQQQSSSDCGAACLAMVSQYWGKRLSLPTLRNLARVDRMGASLQGLAIAAQSLGYDVLPVRASLNKLELHPHPWIAHWQGIHYVVVWKIKGDRILISDPAIGKRWLPYRDFAASWTAYALVLNPTERFHLLKSEKVSLRRYWHILGRHRKLLRQLIFASLLVQVFGLATPLCTQVVIDQVIPLKDFATLNVVAIGLLCLSIWRNIITAQRQYLLGYLANHVDINLIGNFITHTLQLPLQFFASRQVQDIISRVQENRKIQLFLTHQVISASIDAFMAFIYLGLMADYNLQLTLLVLGWILPIVILTLGVSPAFKKASQEIFQESAGYNSLMVEMITGIATIKTAAAEQPVRRHWEKRLMRMLKARFQGQKLANRLQLTRSLINQVGNILVLWFGTSLVIEGQVSLGKFVALNMLTSNVMTSVLALVGLWDEFQQVQISLERVNDILTSEPEENPQKPLVVMPSVRGEVHFDNISFRYHPDQERNTLQNISFQVKPQQTIGIIGQSGSGKSTLVNLLAGLYRPHTGRILIDGYDIAGVSPGSLRSQLGLVLQEDLLFSGTILENITLYNSDLSLEDAIKAAKLADAHTFIQALPLGYNTQVGEGGLRLSDGQSQKIAIARALIRNPGILIFDEATNGLDAESERCFQENLARMSQQCTTFIISHRLFSVRHADHILVLDKGILIEQGNHQELMAIAGLYSHLAQLQFH